MDPCGKSRNYSARSRLFFFIFFVILVIPVLIRAQDPAEIIKRAVQADRYMTGWSYTKEPYSYRVQNNYGSYFTGSATLKKSSGSHVAYIFISLEKHDNPRDAESDYDRRIQYGQRDNYRVSAENFGVGSRCIMHTYYEIYKGGSPVGRQAYEVHAVWEGWRIQVKLWNRLSEDIVDDRGAYRITRSLSEGIFSLLKPSGSAGPPKIHSVRAELKHNSRTGAELKLTAHALYPEPAGNPGPGDVLVSFNLDGADIRSKPGQSGFSVSGREVRSEVVLKAQKEGKHRVTVVFLDTRYKSESDPNLNYEDRFRFDIEIKHPSAEIKGVSGIAALKRISRLTSPDGILYLRDTRTQPAGPENELESINSPWLYPGDRVYLQDTGERMSRDESGNLKAPLLSAIKLEWEGGVKGEAIFRSGLDSRSGWFTIGPTRGLSGNVSENWRRTITDYNILFTQDAWDTAHGMAQDEFDERHDMPDAVEWVLERIPLLGGSIGTAKKYSIFSWLGANSYYSDIRFIELNSRVYIKPVKGGGISIYVLEGSPVLFSGQEVEGTVLPAGKTALCRPGTRTVVADFDPLSVERIWETIIYRPWIKTGGESGTPADRSDIRNEPLDLDLARSIMEGLTEKSSRGIPEIQADITSVRFYESGGDIIPYGQRNYRTMFKSADARAIWWEAFIEHPSPASTVHFDLEVAFYDPQGNELTRHVKKTFIEHGWTSSYHTLGFGWRDKGNWKPGIYRVEFFYRNKRIAQGSFEISP